MLNSDTKISRLDYIFGDDFNGDNLNGYGVIPDSNGIKTIDPIWNAFKTLKSSASQFHAKKFCIFVKSPMWDNLEIQKLKMTEVKSFESNYLNSESLNSQCLSLIKKSVETKWPLLDIVINLQTSLKSINLQQNMLWSSFFIPNTTY